MKTNAKGDNHTLIAAKEKALFDKKDEITKTLRHAKIPAREMVGHTWTSTSWGNHCYGPHTGNPALLRDCYGVRIQPDGKVFFDARDK